MFLRFIHFLYGHEYERTETYAPPVSISSERMEIRHSVLQELTQGFTHIILICRCGKTKRHRLIGEKITR